MKKILSILLALTLLAGCTAAQESVPTETTVPTPQESVAIQEEVLVPTETEPTPVADQLPMVAVSIPLNTNTVYAEDGSAIFRRTSQSMQLTMRDPDVADKIILDFLNRVDSHTATADGVQQAAEAAYTGDTGWNTYFYDLIYDPMRVDHSVLSLYGEIVSYSGGNHPQRQCSSANYNMVTGDVLTLGSILYHIDSKDELAELVIKSLDSIAEEKYLLDDYKEVARQRFNRDESFDEEWYFTSEGLCFYFAPYELAPYSSGVITAQIPYNKLTGIIADEFFPAEEDSSEGSITVADIDDIDMDQFSQIAEVTLDQDGEMFFLYTTGTVRNVCINAVTAGNEMSPADTDHTIFTTYTLTPGDAIMLKLLIDEDVPQLYLSYESGNEAFLINLTLDYINI